ncbi:DegV family protein with EDD domain [Chryseomicrobium aureum]|uniref:DegV family protein n=1 Tax=Chryseomicrobium aureum TaxID=1441723 RepID=UPI00195B770F|nr:DegV family protein [Chryseomicrobium aureum]MBM7705208.1 DegV family protein with EDD domain [Chryseomicrobium aureum]
MKIYADSATDLPLAYFQQADVDLFPLRVHIEGNDYEDILGIQAKEVYDKIREGHQPKTSQVSPETFLQEFESLAKRGEQGVYVAFSSELSGTYNTAVMMRDQVQESYPDFQFAVVDSKCASLGYGMLVKKAVTLRERGLSVSEIEQQLLDTISTIEHFFTVEDLDYMARGGRVSKTSAFVGGLLNIKPVLHVEDGKLIPIEKIRGRKKVIKRLGELVGENGSELAKQTVHISHGDDETAANELKSLLEETYGVKDFEIQMIGSAIGAHVGPGALSVFFYNKLT